MPLFEYACKSCATEFEVLVRARETPECPSCHGKELERRLSVFAAHTGVAERATAGRHVSGPCGSCGDPRGSGACSLN
jgi:putative FmdB family regulatory protein